MAGGAKRRRDMVGEEDGSKLGPQRTGKKAQKKNHRERGNGQEQQQSERSASNHGISRPGGSAENDILAPSPRTKGPPYRATGEVARGRGHGTKVAQRGGGRGARRAGRGGPRDSGRSQKGRGKYHGSSSGSQNKADSKQAKKKEKTTTLRRLVRPKPARLLFLTPTPDEEREVITDAEWHTVDTTTLEDLSDDRPVHLVSEPEQIQPAVKKLKACQFLGLDCEWKPSFRKSDTVPKIDVLQLASEEDAFVFHLTPLLEKIPPRDIARVLAPLRELMTDSCVIKGGQDPCHEMSRLEQTCGWSKGTIRGVLCTQYLSNLFHPSSHSLVALVALFLGKRMPKPKKVQNSNWAKAPLTEKQLAYAGKDATTSRDIMMAMLEAVRERERLKTLQCAVDMSRPLVDSTVPEEFVCSQTHCASCGEQVSELIKKFGMQWASVVLFERCLHDACNGHNVVAIPPNPSFLPQKVAKIQRPGDEKVGGVYLPYRQRDILYSLPATYSGKGIKAKSIFHSAVAKALHHTGESRSNCDLRLEELLSRNGPNFVRQAAAGYKIIVEKKETDKYEAICVKKPIGRRVVTESEAHPSFVFTLEGKQDGSDILQAKFQLLLIRHLQLVSASLSIQLP